MSKLQISGRQCLDLLAKSKKKYVQVETLIKELEFLEQIMGDWRDFADGVDEAVNLDDEIMEDYD